MALGKYLGLDIFMRYVKYALNKGEPRFPLERVDPRVGIILSPLDTHDEFYLS